MKSQLYITAFLGAAVSFACADATAPATARDLQVRVPRVDPPSGSGVTALIADGVESDDGAAADEVPPEFEAPATIRTAWVRAAINSAYAGAEAYMEYWGNVAQQTVALTLLADGRQIANPPPVTDGESWLIPIFGSLRTFASVPVSGACGIAVTATAHHLVKNEWALPGVSPILLSREEESDQGHAGELICPDSTQRPPSEDGASAEDGGAGGDNPDGDQPVYLSCWWKLTFEGETLVDVEALSCTLISS